MWPALIAAGASLVGGILGNQASAKEAEKNRDFQEDMSNTSYQRAVADMKAAGINPMLASKVGGASTPSGATAQQQDVVTPAVNSATNAYYQQQAVENLKKQNENIAADTSVKMATADQVRAQTAEVNARIPTYGVSMEKDTSQTTLNRAEVSRVLNGADEIYERTKFIKDDAARVRAATLLAYEQLKNVSMDSKQKAAYIKLIELEATGQRISNVRGLTGADTDATRLQQLKLLTNKLEAESEKAGTWWGHNVSPYLDDVGTASSSARNIRELFRR